VGCGNLGWEIKARGIIIEPEVDENMPGPASYIVTDLDRNPILTDQQVKRDVFKIFSFKDCKKLINANTYQE